VRRVVGVAVWAAAPPAVTAKSGEACTGCGPRQHTTQDITHDVMLWEKVLAFQVWFGYHQGHAAYHRDTMPQNEGA
jgi:hypothetical protein